MNKISLSQSPKLLPISSIQHSQFVINSFNREDFVSKLFTNWPKSQVKQQLRQIKRINNIETKVASEIREGYDKIKQSIIVTRNSLKDDRRFRTTNLGLFTHNWQELLENMNTGMKYKISAKKSKKPNQKGVLNSVFIPSYCYNSLENFMKKLYQKKIPLESISLTNYNFEIFNIQSNVVAKQNKNSEKYPYSKYQIKSIQLTDFFIDDPQIPNFRAMLSGNRSLETIQFKMDDYYYEMAEQYAQISQLINEEQPQFENLWNINVKFQKISSIFELQSLKIQLSLEADGFQRFLENLTQLKFLKHFSLSIVSSYELKCQEVQKLLSLIQKFQFLEDCSLNLYSFFSESDDISSLGKVVGNCNQLKSLFLKFIECNQSFFNQVNFIDNLLWSQIALDNITVIYKSTNEPKCFLNNYQQQQNILLESKVTKLEFTTYSANQLENLGACLKNMPLLCELTLTINQALFQNGELKRLSKIFNFTKNLKKLQLEFYLCKVSNEDEIMDLGKGIANSLTLEILDLELTSRTNIVNQLFKQAAINENKSLKEISIDLGRCGNLSLDIKQLMGGCSNTFKNCSKVALKVLSMNMPEEALNFGQNLRNLKNLQALKLDLSFCKIDDSHFEALLWQIGQCSGLKCLSLQLERNKIELESIVLNDFLTECVLLEELQIEFSENFICDEGAIKLCKALLNFEYLKYLNLRFAKNNISKDLSQNEIILKLQSKIWGLYISNE